MNDNYTASAEAFIRLHMDDPEFPETRNTQLEQAAQHLILTYSCSQETAIGCAAAALANIESLGINGWIDPRATTKSSLFLYIDGHNHVISLRQIKEAIESETLPTTIYATRRGH